MDVYDPGHQNWMFDYVWPRLEPAFNHVTETAVRAYPDADIIGAAIKQQYPRMSASVEILNRLAPDGAEESAGVLMNCSPHFVYSPGNDRLTGNPKRITCSVDISEGIKAEGKIIKNGPSVEFDLGDDARVRRQLDRWIDASVTFIRDNEGLVMWKLRTRD